jgi:hypothetical protein
MLRGGRNGDDRYVEEGGFVKASIRTTRNQN